MNPINILGFAGAALAPNVRLLAENVGSNVVDAEPGNGELRPLRDRTTVATVPTGTQQQTIYRMGRDTASDSLYWLSWSTVVNAIRGLDPDDTTERTYFTGSGTPKWTNTTIGLSSAPYPQATRELAVPAPSTAPMVTLNTDGTGSDETRFYVRTFVNDIGWESAPSAISTGLTVKPGAIVDITGLGGAPAGNYGITLQRIYRTQPTVDPSINGFYFLREIAIGTTSTQDDARALGELLPTIGWIPLPADAHGLIDLWNGMTAAISGKSILFTEAFKPYAAPIKYQQTVTDTPVALAKWEQNLLVLTTGRSRIMTGSDPAGMSESGSYAGQSCASARGVVEFEHGVAWPSNEGLAYSGSMEVLTLGVIKPEQWRLLRPSTFIAGRWGRMYVASYDDGTGRKGIMIDPLRPTEGVWFLTSGFHACYYDKLVDALFVLEGGNVRKFAESGSRLTAKFVSKVFHQVGPRNFGYAKVVADSYPLTLKVYADGALKVTRTVTNGFPFTLPSGFTAEDWQAEVQSAFAVQAIHLATDIRDFKTG